MKTLETKTIPLSKIVADKNQPRKYFDAVKLARLKKSISENGILNPLTVEMVGDKYLLVDGERRFRASLELGLKEVPAVILAPQSASQRLIQQFHVQEMHEGWTGPEKAMAVYNLSQEMGIELPEICKLLDMQGSTARTYIGFGELLDKKHYERAELNVEWARYVTNLRMFAQKTSETKNKEAFTVAKGKAFERAIINRIKNGSIQGIKDLSKIRDSIKADVDMVDKVIETNITSDEMLDESRGDIPRLIRQLSHNSGFVMTVANRILTKRNVSIPKGVADRLQNIVKSLEKFLETVTITD